MNKVELNNHLIELKSGNIDALSNIYELTKNQVYAICLSILKDRGLAEDAMQSTYIRVREKINYYAENSNGYAWILTIARNISINNFKRETRVTSTDFNENEYLAVSSDSTEFNDMPIFKIAKSVLSEEELQIVTLYVVSGYKHREIAAMLDKPLGTVLWSYTNSLKKIKKAIKGKEV